MPYTIGNVGKSIIVDPATNDIRTAFLKLESIEFDFDGKMTEVYGGSTTLPSWHIPADRKPQVTYKGPEVPLSGFKTLLGMNQTDGQAGTPIIVPWVDYVTIDAAGKINLTNPISATAISVSVKFDNGPLLTQAPTPTTGEYTAPAASAEFIQGATADAGKNVVVRYSFDSTSGSQIDYIGTSVPSNQKVITTAELVDSNGGPNMPASVVVNLCKFIGDWKLSEGRMKPTSTDLTLSVLDPGGSTPAMSIFSTAKAV